jgi:hypothetical protein
MVCVIDAFLLATYFLGNFLTFLKQQGLTPFPLTNGGSFSVPSALQANRAIVLLGILSTIARIPFETQCLVRWKLEE